MLVFSIIEKEFFLKKRYPKLEKLLKTLRSSSEKAFLKKPIEQESSLKKLENVNFFIGSFRLLVILIFLECIFCLFLYFYMLF